MNKKIIIFFVSFIFMLTFTACGDNFLFSSVKDTKDKEIVASDDDSLVQNESSETEKTETEEIEPDSPSELEEYFSDPVNMVKLENEVAMSRKDQKIFSNTKVKVSGNRIIMEFYCKDHYGDIQKLVESGMSVAKNKIISHIRSYCDTKEQIEVEFIYYNPDDSVAADYVMVENEDDGSDKFETSAKEGTIQYFYESEFGEEYWSAVGDILMQQDKGQFSEIKVECVNNTLIYTIFCKQQIGNVQKEFENLLSEDFKNLLLKEMKDSSGVKDKIKIVYIFVNPDGSTACEIGFEG